MAMSIEDRMKLFALQHARPLLEYDEDANMAVLFAERLVLIGWADEDQRRWEGACHGAQRCLAIASGDTTEAMAWAAVWEAAQGDPRAAALVAARAATRAAGEAAYPHDVDKAEIEVEKELRKEMEILEISAELGDFQLRQAWEG